MSSPICSRRRTSAPGGARPTPFATSEIVPHAAAPRESCDHVPAPRLTWLSTTPTTTAADGHLPSLFPARSVGRPKPLDAGLLLGRPTLTQTRPRPDPRERVLRGSPRSTPRWSLLPPQVRGVAALCLGIDPPCRPSSGMSEHTKAVENARRATPRAWRSDKIVARADALRRAASFVPARTRTPSGPRWRPPSRRVLRSARKIHYLDGAHGVRELACASSSAHDLMFVHVEVRARHEPR